MKKSYYLLLLLASAYMLMGCDDNIITNEPPAEVQKGEISIAENERNIWFSTKGGEVTISVTATEDVEWDALPNSSRIIVSNVDQANGKFTIKVEATEDINDFTNGEVVVYASNANAVTINVGQRGVGNIHEKSHLRRMNLRGDVKSLDVYGDMILQKYIRNLEFNRDGYLTKYDFITYAVDLINGNEFHVEIEYDNENRIKTIHGKSPTLTIENVGSEEYKFEFEYGDHGMFIETSRFFTVKEGMNAYSYFDLWVPEVIKNLKSVKIYNTGMLPQNGSVEFQVDGNTGSATLHAADVPSQTMATYEFKHGYPWRVHFTYALGGAAFDQTTEYLFSTKNGNLITQETIVDIWNAMIFRKEYDDNEYNSLAYWFADNDTYDTLSIFYWYDSEGNLKAAGTDYVEANAEVNFNYVYDNIGNWTEVNWDNNGAKQLTRSFEYYK